MRHLSYSLICAVTAVAACQKRAAKSPASATTAIPDFHKPADPGFSAQAPDSFRARFSTTKGDFVSTGRYELDTLPHPITPVRTRLGAPSAPNALTLDARALPASKVVLVNSRRFMVGLEVLIGFKPLFTKARCVSL